MRHPLILHSWWIAPLALLFGLALTMPFAPGPPPDDSPYLRIDPEKIVLNPRNDRQPCGECHLLEYEVWQGTPHATTFDELHRTEQARAILDRMGLRLAKRESLCLRCHYTTKIVDEQPRAIAGVSCESCHGAARDWLDIHNNFGGATRQTETAEHRAVRVAQSREAGMLRPSDDLYAVAANCFECHTVPNEQLVNVGGHLPGSAFELLDWSAEIRHNFVDSQGSTDQTNRAPTPERRRMMYVLGRALDYEYSLRALAKATTEGLFAQAMAQRVQRAGREIDRILDVADVPALQEARALGEAVALGPGNGEALGGAAGQIGEVMRAFARAHDGSTLEAIDPLLASSGDDG
ncbi:MAG: cytochrome c family protein [Rhodothermales bacterium]